MNLSLFKYVKDANGLLNSNFVLITGQERNITDASDNAAHLIVWKVDS